VGGEGRGELVVWLVKLIGMASEVGMEKGMCKAGPLDDQDHLDKQKWKPNKKGQLC